MRKNSTATSAPRPRKHRTVLPRTTLILAVSAVIILAFALSIHRLQARLARQATIRQYQQRLEKWAPTLHRITAKDQALRHNRQTAEALARWKQESPRLQKPLQLIAQETPECIQLQRLTFISAPDKFPTSPLSPWDQSLDIQGLVIHPEAEILVLRFQQALSALRPISRLAPNLKLISFTRPETAPELQTNTTPQAGFLLSGNSFEQKQSTGP